MQLSKQPHYVVPIACHYCAPFMGHQRNDGIGLIGCAAIPEQNPGLLRS
jgi:hypothetical protein